MRLIPGGVTDIDTKTLVGLRIEYDERFESRLFIFDTLPPLHFISKFGQESRFYFCNTPSSTKAYVAQLIAAGILLDFPWETVPLPVFREDK